MKFPISHCVPTKHLTKEKYDWLLCKLISDGYHLPSGSDKSLMFDMWKYLGVDINGSVHLYDDPANYMEVNAWQLSSYAEGVNVLPEDFLNGYLYEG